LGADRRNLVAIGAEYVWGFGLSKARIIHERLERLDAFVSKTVGAGRLDRTKNAAQANDRARKP